jgi:NAD(P)-dependent dehydrogenase (short-subunit alcohol dehydrogenase family)
MSTAVVTGGAKGIGEGVAARLAAKGWRVAIVDSDAAAAEETARRLGTDHAAADVTDPDTLAAVFADVAGRHGRIDALVTSAGITRIGPSGEQSPADWRAVVDVDLSGTFFACQAAYPHLPPGGAIVTVASIAAFRGLARRSAYCAAKAGVVALTRCLAVEWAERGVRVNSVAPGWVDTPFLRAAAERGDVDLDELAGRPPLRGLATVADVTGVIEFLLSTEARVITGQTVCADGGWVWAG